MKKVFVIPTYWGPPLEHVKSARKDFVLEHVTPLDGQCPVINLLDSLKKLNDKDFTVVLLGVSNHRGYDIQIQKKLQALINPYKEFLDVKLFALRQMTRIRDLLTIKGFGELTEHIEYGNPGQIKNLGLLAAHVLGAEIAIILKDNSLIESPDWLGLAIKNMGRVLEGKNAVYGAMGCSYIDGVKEKLPEWKEKSWDESSVVEEFFNDNRRNMFLEGNTVVHRKLFKKIPYDPFILGKEDIDYLISSRMYGFEFIVDEKFCVKSNPVPEKPEEWECFKREAMGYMHIRKKLKTQPEAKEDFVPVSISSLRPYPGKFLESTLIPKMRSAGKLLTLQYNKTAKSDLAEKTEELISTLESAYEKEEKVFEKYNDFVYKWRKLMRETSDFDNIFEN